MKLFQFDRFGLDHLRPRDAPIPVPAPHEVLLQVRALSLNALDLLVIKGIINPGLALPHVPICDAAGTVVAVGAAVTTLAVGDNVTSLLIPHWREGPPIPAKLDKSSWPGLGRAGYLAEYVAVSAGSLIRQPTHLMPAEAATLPTAGLTAWNALKYAHLQPGETVLVHGAGGVSLFTLQFAKARGCRVLITSKDDAKLARARALGADETFNYATQPDWVNDLLARTDGRGADAVVETVGGDNLTLSLRALAMRGRIVIMGLQKGTQAPLDVLALLGKQARLIGMEVGSTKDFEAMNRAIESGKLHPIVDKVFPVDDVREALHRMESGHHFGKICLTF